MEKCEEAFWNKRFLENWTIKLQVFNELRWKLPSPWMDLLLIFFGPLIPPPIRTHPPAQLELHSSEIERDLFHQGGWTLLEVVPVILGSLRSEKIPHSLSNLGNLAFLLHHTPHCLPPHTQVLQRASKWWLCSLGGKAQQQEGLLARD